MRIEVRIEGHLLPKGFYVAKHRIILVALQLLVPQLLVLFVVLVGGNVHFKSSWVHVKKHVHETNLGNKYLLKSESDSCSRIYNYFSFLLNKN